MTPKLDSVEAYGRRWFVGQRVRVGSVCGKVERIDPVPGNRPVYQLLVRPEELPHELFTVTTDNLFLHNE